MSATGTKPAAVRPRLDGSVTRLFDIGVQTAPPAELLRQILSFAENGDRHRVSYVNAHVLNQTFSNPDLRRALQSSDLVYCDGYGVRLAARLIGLPVPHRMTGADWIWGVAALCHGRGRWIHLLGADPGSSTDAAAAPKRGYPRLRVLGSHHGYFDPGSPHSERVLEHIAGLEPDIVLVGMGTPQQELWVDHNLDRVEAPVVWTVGALFDYLSGRTPR